MPFYTEEQIKQARSIDLLTYLQTYEPTELVHLRGDTYCTREHDSLKISNGKWMWWSRNIGGTTALDYLIKVKGMKFMDAMRTLIRSEGARMPALSDRNQPGKSEEVRKEFSLPERAETNIEVIKYLTGRGIDREIIRECIEEGLLYESLPYHSCVFIGRDDMGKEAYASYRATGVSKFKGEALGSDKRYSFRIDAPGSTIHVFESAIDLLSYATVIKKNTGNWRTEPMLSLGGVFAHSAYGSRYKLPAALMNALEGQQDIRTIALHLDADEPGRAAARSIAELLQDRFVIRDEPPPVGKDCNDYLIHLKKNERNRTMTERDSGER